MKVIFFLTCLFLLLQAAPAREASHTFVQSDASSFSAKQKGDEYLHWLESVEGDIIIYNRESGNYEYGVIKGDTLRASGIIYKEGERKVRSIKNDILKLWQKKRREHH